MKGRENENSLLRHTKVTKYLLNLSFNGGVETYKHGIQIHAHTCSNNQTQAGEEDTSDNSYSVQIIQHWWVKMKPCRYSCTFGLT